MYLQNSGKPCNCGKILVDGAVHYCEVLLYYAALKLKELQRTAEKFSLLSFEMSHNWILSSRFDSKNFLAVTGRHGFLFIKALFLFWKTIRLILWRTVTSQPLSTSYKNPTLYLFWPTRTSTCHHFKILYYNFVKIYTKLHLFTLSFLNRYCLGKMFLDPIWSEHTWRKTFGICLPSGIPKFETFHLNDDRSPFSGTKKSKLSNFW